MNPEQNNPLTNTGTPNFGGPADQSGQGLSMADTLASAQDSLTSAGMAAGGGASTPIGLDSIDGLSGGANPSATIEDRPLVPAAPVPGSIGSVTSVPSLPPTENPQSPFTPVDPNLAMNNPAQNVEPTAQPTQAAYNPFSQTPTDLNPAPAAPAPIQPQAEGAGKAKKPSGTNSLTIILGILALVAIISTAVFAFMFFKAKDETKVVYVPSFSEDESNATMKVLSCTHENDYNYLIGYDHPVMGTENITLNYSGDELSSVEIEHVANYDNEADAVVAKDNLASMQTALVNDIIAGNYTTDGVAMRVELGLAEGATLDEENARKLIYGEAAAADTSKSLALDAVEQNYQDNGYICTVE